MNKQVIYLKETNSEDDVLKKEHTKLPLFFKKIIFLYKNIFNIVTKKKIENSLIWVLPVKVKYSLKKIEKILNKELKNKENIYLVSKELKESKISLIMDEQKIEYITEEKIKKILIFDVLKYIVDIQDKQISDKDVTVLVNNTSNINMYILEEVAKQVKTLKIVSLNIYKFKNLEEKLYTEYGIPIQFSNSYRKSLEKSKLIINLDFNDLEINEYEIFNKAIIFNCVKENVKIKTRLFNGIVINSLDIEYKTELVNKFRNMKVLENYTRLELYASIIEDNSIQIIKQKLNSDNVSIISLIGANRVINKNEFKNIFKSLDKNEKTE